MLMGFARGVALMMREPNRRLRSAALNLAGWKERHPISRPDNSGCGATTNQAALPPPRKSRAQTPARVSASARERDGLAPGDTPHATSAAISANQTASVAPTAPFLATRGSAFV
jgi:hypothetical protein